METNEDFSGNPEAEDATDPSMPGMEELVAKALLVKERMMALRQEIDETVFTGTSEDGSVEISLCGDGEPKFARLNWFVTDKVSGAVETAILEALADIYNARMQRLERGLKALEEETGVGPGFTLPF